MNVYRDLSSNQFRTAIEMMENEGLSYSEAKARILEEADPEENKPVPNVPYHRTN